MTNIVLIVLKLMAIWPRPLLQGLGKAFGWFKYVTNSHAARISRENIQLCYPQLSQKEKTQLLRSSLSHTAQTFFETPSVWLSRHSATLPWIDELMNETLLTTALDSPKGVIIVLPHFGNWELFNIYFSKYGPMTALYQPPRQQYLKGIMQYVRSGFGNSIVPTTKMGLLRLARCLDSGGVVTILPDQVPRKGIFSDFFGNQALTDILIPRLLRRTGAVAVAITIRRKTNGHFTLVCQEPDSDIYALSDKIAARGVNKTVESCVAQAPEQYQWEYKRFRERPVGEKKLYRFDKPEEFHSPP